MRRALILMLGCLATVGCVERKMVITSNPPGAELYVDGTFLGHTPRTLSFDFYGTRDVLLRHPTHESQLEKLVLDPPWYQTTPLDFFVEHLWPTTLTDVQRLDVELAPMKAQSKEDLQALRKRAETYREEVRELERTDPDGTKNPELDPEE